VRIPSKSFACIMLTALMTLSLALGCGRKAATPPAPPAAQTPNVPLPEWAPMNPSPEFLRAAKVLKPIPPELLARIGETSPSAGVAVSRYSMTLIPAYEFFGTLSDEQVERFLSSDDKKILIPVKSLTARQRAALDTWFDTYQKVNEGTMPPDIKWAEDYRVVLYKTGAKRDLSNVRVGFIAKAGHAVHILFCITRQDGSQDGACSQCAQI